MSRVDGDNYPTEEALVMTLLDRVRITGPVLEPAAGAGSVASALRKNGLHVVTNDIAYGEVVWSCLHCGQETTTQVQERDTSIRKFEPKKKCKRCGAADELASWAVSGVTAYNCDYHLDATRRELWRVAPYQWVVANPPYSHLDDILSGALQYARLGVAMLLRLSALEPAITRSTRGYSLIAYSDSLRYVMPFSAPRPSYTVDGKTDAITTAWFVWDLGWSWKSMEIESPFQFITNWKRQVGSLPKLAGGK